ncbi:MAG TPA: YopT-type cysteine protease domain-containing protein [Labilithrix sp.]|nr:YopT-type cysteine protease domain-containing protein [Labilithrix sp.]
MQEYLSHDPRRRDRTVNGLCLSLAVLWLVRCRRNPDLPATTRLDPMRSTSDLVPAVNVQATYEKTMAEVIQDGLEAHDHVWRFKRALRLVHLEPREVKKIGHLTNDVDTLKRVLIEHPYVLLSLSAPFRGGHALGMYVQRARSRYLRSRVLIFDANMGEFSVRLPRLSDFLKVYQALWKQIVGYEWSEVHAIKCEST